MYRIMIVDDEPLILAGITSLLNWEEYQYKIVGKASNGQQALSQMEELRPDIVITDIKMPAMDGITFLRTAREKGYDAEFILLTNLEEFSLAKEAFHLGVVDYLVKLELSEEELIRALENASSRCLKKKKQQEPAAAQEAVTMEERIRNYFRYLLIYDMEAPADETLLAVMNVRFSMPLVMLINFNYGFEGFSKAFTRDDQKKVMGLSEHIIGDMIKGFFDQTCFLRREQNGFVLILSLSGVEDYREQIQIMSGRLRQVMKDYFEVPISIAVSQAGSSMQEVQELLYQAMNAMNYTYYESEEGVVFYSERCEENSKHSNNFNINFLKKDLTGAIWNNDSAMFSDIMSQIIELFSECRPSRTQAVNACNNLYYFITSLIENREDCVFPYAVDIVGQLNRMDSLGVVLQWLRGFCREVMGILDSYKESRGDKNIDLAKRYIFEHYKEKITLGQAASALSLSQGYLSSTFKKQTGKGFSDYVTEVKIEKAKELIQTHDYMMYEISDMLGFDTQYYFSAVFKKITGQTPTEYENRVIRTREL